MSDELNSAVDRLDRLRKARRGPATDTVTEQIHRTADATPAQRDNGGPIAGNDEHSVIPQQTENDYSPASTLAANVNDDATYPIPTTEVLPTSSHRPIVVDELDATEPIVMPLLSSADTGTEPAAAATSEGDVGAGAADSVDQDSEELGAIDTDRLVASGGRRRVHRSTLAMIALAALLVCAVLVAATVIFSSNDRSASPSQRTTPAVAKPTIQATTAPALADGPVPLTAKAVGTCPGGTDAAGAIDGRQETAWVCPSGGTGKVVRLTLPEPYVITAVSIVPGFNYRNPNGADEWMNYQVVRRLTWIFNDAGKTTRPQTTSGLRSPAVLEVPNVVASQITVLVQQTQAPTDGGQTPPTTSGADGGGLFGDEATGGSTQTVSKSPTGLAISELNVIGHKVN